MRTLYNGAHIPGAVYYGPGSSEQGIADLKEYAATFPKDSDVVLYCGCCPLEKCPNLRPAFTALKDMGIRTASRAASANELQHRLGGKRLSNPKRQLN